VISGVSRGQDAAVENYIRSVIDNAVNESDKVLGKHSDTKDASLTKNRLGVLDA